MGNDRQDVHESPPQGPKHAHTFGLEKKQGSERRTHIVIALTAITMVVEISAGLLFGSMALLADGIHMASHTVALGIVAFAYWYARKHASDSRFSFGTGKVNALGGFTGAILLALFAFLMAWESVDRFFNPVDIAFNQALLVAILGLVVNGVSVFVLGGHGHSHAADGHSHADDHSHADGLGGHGHDGHKDQHHDHNRRAAYLHVLADALTSLAAIVALLAGKLFGVLWVDPLMGIAGSVLVAKWSYGLLKQTAAVLLDRQDEKMAQAITETIEGLGSVELYDVHVWAIAPGKFAAIVGILAPSHYAGDEARAALMSYHKLAHLSVECRLQNQSE